MCFTRLTSRLRSPPHSSLPIPDDCIRACCFTLLRLLAPSSSSGSGIQHSMQQEFIVTEVVGAWPRLSVHNRLQLTPHLFQVRYHLPRAF
jgi:hypothetical protein